MYCLQSSNLKFDRKKSRLPERQLLFDGEDLTFLVFLFPLECVRFGLKSHQDYENGRPLTPINIAGPFKPRIWIFPPLCPRILGIIDDVI